MISTSRQFLFIHVPKTGGNSIQGVLRAWSDEQVVCTAPHQDGVERFELRSDTHDTVKHSTLAEYRRAYGDALVDGLFKFTCVRNPWDRCISHFFSPHRGPVVWTDEAFARFVQAEVMPLRHYADGVDHVMRFEALQADFDAVCRRLDLPRVDLPRRNVAPRDAYRGYYDATTAALVAGRFADEIERFGYAF